MTPDEMDRAATFILGFIALGAVTFGVLSTLYFNWRERQVSDVSEEGGEIMSHDAEQSRPALAPRIETGENGSYRNSPDTYQAEGATPPRTNTPPPVSSKASDAEIIAWLATCKTVDNGKLKDRFSANKIADLVGGTRADVMNQVRAIRNLPTYRERTPEQEAFRSDLAQHKASKA